MFKLKRAGSVFVSLLVVVTIIGAIVQTDCFADVYRWKDKNGYWHFSDSPVSAGAEYEPVPSESAAPPKADAAATIGNDLPEANAESSAVSTRGGMFWRVSNGTSAPSYLLGTIHSADPRVVNLRPPVAQALDQSDRFVMEMIFDASALMRFGTTMVFTDGRELPSVLGPDLFKQVVKAMRDYGLPEMYMQKMKPWVIMTMLSMPKPSQAPILDLVLHQRAVNAGKPASGLESAQEQLSVFEGLSMQEQIQLLEMTLSQLPDMPQMMERLLQAYIKDDLDAIAKIAADYKRQGDDALLKKFTYRLNDARNLRMIRRMTHYLKQGNSFIAVGALHLAGPGGLVALLRQDGYTFSLVR